MMTGEATEGAERSLGAGGTHTQERVKSLKWREGKEPARNSITEGDSRQA